MISLTIGCSYPAFGIALSLLASYGLMRLVDLAVNRLRNVIRGERMLVRAAPPSLAAAKATF